MDYQIIMLVVLIISIVLHEVAHGYAANKLGDPTAKLQGRLSLNPLVHLDPVMSVLVPGLLFFSGSPILFGAAKPVPYNPYNFSDQKYGEAKVALAGPLANIGIAVFFGLLIRLGDVLSLSQSFIEISVGIIVMNLFLAFFNLLPLPPLDGSKILPVLLPLSAQTGYRNFVRMMEQNIILSFVLIVFLVTTVLGGPLSALTSYVTAVLVGV